MNGEELRRAKDCIHSTFRQIQYTYHILCPEIIFTGWFVEEDLLTDCIFKAGVLVYL